MRQVLSGQRVGVSSDVGRGAGGDDLAAGAVLEQAKVDDVVGVDDKMQVVFDHGDGGPLAASLSNTRRSVCTSRACRPTLGSSRTKTVPV